MQKLLNGKSNVLIIFIKYPQAGTVKTRLANSIGKENAARLYRASVEAILKRTKSRSFQRMLFFTPAHMKKAITDWLGNRLIIQPQKGRTLGEKLSQGFQFAFTNGAKRVVIIGSDSPTLHKELICDTFRKLKDTQCVIGPALDGGYYLIGLSSFIDRIFKGIRWGTESVFNQTIVKLKQLKIKYTLLSKSFDIDSYYDIILLKKILQKDSPTNLIGLRPIIRLLEKII